MHLVPLVFLRLKLAFSLASVISSKNASSNVRECNFKYTFKDAQEGIKIDAGGVLIEKQYQCRSYV